MKNDVFQSFDSIEAFCCTRDHNSPQNWALQHFQKVLSLDIGDTEQDTVGP